jgi:hypothetical protein
MPVLSVEDSILSFIDAGLTRDRAVDLRMRLWLTIIQ